jgi:hypothetical protein
MAQRKNEKIKFPRMFIEWEVTDRDGKLIDKGRKESQTWVGNIVRMLWQLFTGGTTGGFTTGTSSVVNTPSNIRDTSNTARPIGLTSTTINVYTGVSGGAGVLIGIVAGSSDTPVAIDQYDLVAKILHGTGTGQLFYNANTVEALSDTPPTYRFRIVRTMTNQSGGSITVREIGLFYQIIFSGSPHVAVCMLARDVLTTPITVPAGSTLTVRYIISHSV